MTADVSVTSKLRVLPKELYDSLLHDPREQFVEEFEDTLLLAVLVSGLGKELLHGLEECYAEATGRWIQRGGVTGAQTMVAPISEAFVRAASRPAAPSHFDAGALRAQLSEGTYFVTPMRKRAGDLAGERLTVGRSRQADIILRHKSVSKSHAWMEFDESELYYVCDTDSTNSTQLNGRVLDSEVLERFEPGDRIRFGEVETVVCSAALLWDAVMGFSRP